MLTATEAAQAPGVLYRLEDLRGFARKALMPSNAMYTATPAV